MTVIDVFGAALGVVLLAFAIAGTGVSWWQINEENHSRTGGRS